MAIKLCHVNKMIKEFTVGVAHTINLGNYQSLRVEASVTVAAEDEGWEAVRQQAQDGLKILLEDSFNAQAKPAWFAQIPTKARRT